MGMAWARHGHGMLCVNLPFSCHSARLIYRIENLESSGYPVKITLFRDKIKGTSSVTGTKQRYSFYCRYLPT